MMRTNKRSLVRTFAGFAGAGLGFLTLLGLRTSLMEGPSIAEVTVGLTGIFAVASGYYLAFSNDKRQNLGVEVAPE